MSLPQQLHPAVCPTCQRPYPVGFRDPQPLTERELDALSAWWHYRSVQLAAVLIGVSEQRAKNLLASARRRCGARTNGGTVGVYLGQLRSKEALIESHNVLREEGQMCQVDAQPCSIVLGQGGTQPGTQRHITSRSGRVPSTVRGAVRLLRVLRKQKASQ